MKTQLVNVVAMPIVTSPEKLARCDSADLKICDSSRCGLAGIFPIVDARVSSEVCPLFFGPGAPGALLRAFADAGLSGGEERRESRGLHFSDDEVRLSAVLLVGPVAMAVKRFTSDEMEAVRAEFLASVAAYRQQDGSYAVPGEFVTVAAEA